MRLADFITGNMEDILKQWETFARSIQPGEEMNAAELRDHAEAMLKVIAADLGKPQTDRESIVKSRGDGPKHVLGTSAAESHAEERLRSGFSTDLLVAEYRALRASVLRLWLKNNTVPSALDVGDIIRFNEAVDQALAESVENYSHLVSESQDIFLGILGHDLRSPLQAVSIGSAYLMRSENADPRMIQLGARMHNSTLRMSEMLDDLLDYTKLRIGKEMRLVREQTDLALICAQVIDEFKAAHPGRIIHVLSSGDCTGKWDGKRVGQVYQNLVGNALQYSAPQSPIEVVLEGSAHEVLFSIRNQGRPIPEEEQKTLFDPLRRHMASGSEETSSSKNLGLGLFIAREAVVAHGGTINLSSTHAEGTAFNVTLPK